MTFDEIYKHVENIPGWMGEKDCRALHEAVKNVYGTIVEIGAFMGKSAIVMALSSPKSFVAAIDPYLSVHSSAGEITPIDALKGFLNNTRDLHNIRLFPMTSEEFGKGINRSIDFLHIDGDHHYEMVKKDIELFVPHVKKDRWVYFHDYVVESSEEEGGRVKEAVHDMADKYFSEVKTVSGFAACRKK